MKYTEQHPLTVFEAFAGYGSQSIALERLRRDYGLHYKVVGISEIEPAAIKAYNAIHGKGIPNFGDITKINWGGQIPDFELFTYSFPCTSISNAGKQAGLTENSGTASSLLWYCRKAIEIKRPKYLLMENVKALLQKKFQPQFHKWLHELEDFGYTNFYKVLNAKDFGVAQNRERVFMVSIHDCDQPYTFPDGFELTKCVEDYLESPALTRGDYYIDQTRVTNKVLSDLLDQEYVRVALEKLYHDEWRERMQANSD